LKKPDKLKPFPAFNSDEEAEKFVEQADLSEFDFSGFAPAHFEFAKKDERVNMRLPSSLLRAVKDRAAREGVPYQRFIRQTLERAIAETTKAPA
jgi:predicted DNA binding CopG/RHH family protein